MGSKMPWANWEEPANEPLVSVVIPAYNSSRFIGRTVDSVLKQTFSGYELIVVNDGSPDTHELEAALEPYLPRVRYFSQENRGPSAARNLGIQKAAGRYVAFLDSDDAWLPHHLSEQVRHLERDGGLGLIYSNNLQVDDDGYTSKAFDRVPQNGPVTLESLLAERCTVNTSSVVVRRVVLVEAGLFDEKMWRCEDFDLWLRLASQGVKMTYDPDAEVLHRVTTGLSWDKEAMKRARKDVYRKALATLTLTSEQRSLVTSKIRELDKEIELEAAKRHLSARTYDQALAAIKRARALSSDRRLGVAENALRYCPGFFRWCYAYYVQALHAHKRRHRAGWQEQGANLIGTGTTLREKVPERPGSSVSRF
jgi:glycosyltransferase involved in cell wall biosynthesis